MIVNGKLYHPTFHVSNAPIARKAWTCTLCQEPVRVGERYVRYTWRKETEIDDLPFHPECWTTVKAYCKANNTTVFAVEDVLSWLKTTWHCKRCKLQECHISRCEKNMKYFKHKPIKEPYSTLLSIDEKMKPDESQFKILDE